MDLHERAIKVLRASHGFGVLDIGVLNDLADALSFDHVAGGTQIYREGAQSDSMLFVISGGLRVSRQVGDGQRLYNEVRPGQSVGEVGLILQQPRSADVTAIRDSTLAFLSLASYETLLVRHPLALNRVFTKAVHHFMRHVPSAQQHYAHSVAVVPLHEGADADEVARGLAEALSRMGSVHVLRRSADQPVLYDAQHAGAQVDELEGAHDFLVYEADASVSGWTRRAFRQADQVIYVAMPGAAQTISDIERGLDREPGAHLKRKHLVLLHADGEGAPRDVDKWRGVREFERVYPVRSGHDGDFARLARFLTGTAVGVVLGGGGARGFAHVGVLRALEERGIPVDLIGGNSMGALIGAQYACGVPLEEIRVRTQAFAAGGERLTLPLVSLVSGRRVERDLHRMFGDTTVEQLWLPFFAAACNLSKGSTQVQDQGPLWRAVLASNSPAGLFPPVLERGDLLVDGAILDNVPVQAMRMRLGTPLEKRRGNGTIIAIDVDVQKGPTAPPGLARLSMWSALRAYLAPGPQPWPNIATILYSAGHIGGAAQRGRTIAQADLYLEPPVDQFPLMGYRRSGDIAEVGYRHAIESIDKWTQPITPDRVARRA
jgi:NTE family protein/lysophospholipid hydrolase